MHILTGVGTADGLKIGATLGIGVGIYTKKGTSFVMHRSIAFTLENSM